MANHGNTGQRYKSPKVASVAIEDETHVKTEMECGHTYVTSKWDSLTIEQYLEHRRERVGKRERCTQCNP